MLLITLWAGGWGWVVTDWSRGWDPSFFLGFPLWTHLHTYFFFEFYDAPPQAHVHKSHVCICIWCMYTYIQRGIIETMAWNFWEKGFERTGNNVLSLFHSRHGNVWLTLPPQCACRGARGLPPSIPAQGPHLRSQDWKLKTLIVIRKMTTDHKCNSVSWQLKSEWIRVFFLSENNPLATNSPENSVGST